MRWADLTPERRTLGRVLRDQAEVVGDDLFLLDPTTRWTYADVDERVNRVAHGFASIGVGKGDNVALFMTNSAEMVIVTLALSRLGAVWIPMNTALKGEWIDDILGRVVAATVVVDALLLDQLFQTRLPGVTSVVVVGTPKPHDTSVERINVYAYEDVLDDRIADLGGARDYREVVAVMWTSGTTGAPKGIMQTHSSWLIGSAGLSGYRDFEDHEVLYCCLPMFNSGGWSLNVFGAMVAGQAVAIDPAFTASRFWERCRTYGATQIVTLGAMYDFLLQAERRPSDREHNVRVAACIPIPPGRVDEFKDRFGIAKLWNGYAQSELMWMTGASPDRRWKPGSCGESNPDVELAILDPGDRPVAVGEVGEICARPRKPFMMFAGYFGDPQQTVTATKNLWYHTGDMGFLDEDGELFFADRRSDLMRFGGRTVSAADVERACAAHPDVTQVAAFGIPAQHLESEAEVMVAVVLRAGASLTADELAAFVNDTAPHYLVPRYIDVVDALPLTPTGKVEKRSLKEAGVTPSTWDRVEAGYTVRKR